MSTYEDSVYRAAQDCNFAFNFNQDDTSFEDMADIEQEFGKSIQQVRKDFAKAMAESEVMDH